MKINMNGGSTVTINGKTYHGNSVSMVKNQIIIDGEIQSEVDGEAVTVTVNGNVDSLQLGAGEVSVLGSVNRISSSSGVVTCKGVCGSVKSQSGDINCSSVGGSVSSMSGDIYLK